VTSQGLPLFRQHIADYITQRDGFKCDMKNIFITNGGSDGIQVEVIFSCIFISISAIQSSFTVIFCVYVYFHDLLPSTERGHNN